jgi:hypothetical protein
MNRHVATCKNCGSSDAYTYEAKSCFDESLSFSITEYQSSND